MHPFFEKVLTNKGYRLKLFLCISLICNFIYALFLFVISQQTHSKWFFVMSVYFGMLSFTRIFIFSQLNPQRTLRNKIILMRVCGYLLLLLNIIISIMMFTLIYTASYAKHQEITAIALAAYTFSTLSIAIVSSVKYIKSNRHTFICVKVINLVSASVSMVTLTNTMLATWGSENLLLRGIILPILSGFVSIFIVSSAMFMIKKANSDLRMVEHEEK